MFRTNRPSAAALLCTAALFLYAPSVFAQAKDTAQPARIRAVIAGGDAFLPGPAEMVAAARAEVIPNPTGRYALIVRRDEAPPPGPAIGQEYSGGAAILLYDAVARRTRVLWEQSDAHGTRHAGIGMVAWFPGTDALVAWVQTAVLDAPTPEGREPVTTLLFADAVRDVRARPLTSTSSANGFSVSVSPTRPLAAISTNPPLSVPEDQQALQVRFLDAKGKFSPPVDMRGRRSVMGWLDDGTTLAINHLASRDANGIWLRHYYKLAPETGQITELAARPKPADLTRETPPTSALLRTFSGSGTAVPPPKGTDGAKAVVLPLQSLWLAAKQAGTPPSPVFLAPLADAAWLLPDTSAVLYSAQSAVYAVPLIRLPLARYEAAQRSAWRRTAIQNAKQIGLAMLMYAQDHAEKYPPTDGYHALLSDYVKNDTIFNNPVTGMPGFTYLMSAVAISSITEVAKTPLGYLAGPGGRAVVYADGHVNWEEPPPNN